MSPGAVREDWKRVLKLTSPEEAIEKLLKSLEIKPKIEEVDVINCLGRVLAEDVVAQQDIPPYDCACFEGYAIKSEDTLSASKSKPVKLKIVGKMLPGLKEIPKVESGQAVFVVTGAPMPPGADALVRVEETRLENGYVLVFRAVKRMENVASKGEDVRAGSSILKAGHVIRPVDVGLLMSLGYSKVKVYAKPRVAIISVGRDLYLKSLSAKGTPPNNYAYVIKGLIEEIGGIADVLGIIPDDVEVIKKTLGEALDRYDVVLTMGSCSIGINDAVPDAVNSLGGPGVIVHGLNLSPGKPAGFGIVGGKPIIMLPAHIVSAVAAFYTLCLPLLATMTGRELERMLPYVYAKLDGHEEPWGGYRFLRLDVRDVDGEFVARPMHGGANVMMTLVRASHFTILPPGVEVKRGDRLKLKALSLLHLLP